MAEIIGGMGLFFCLLWGMCARVRVGSGGHKALGRCVTAVWALALCGLLPGASAGVNAATVLLCCALGAPGFALAQVLAAMP